MPESLHVAARETPRPDFATSAVATMIDSHPQASCQRDLLLCFDYKMVTSAFAGPRRL